MMPKLNLLLFWGQLPYHEEPSLVETTMDQLLQVTLVSTLDRAIQTKRFDRYIVVSNDARLAPLLDPQVEFLLEPDNGEVFHFGRALRNVITQAEIKPDEAVIYFGAGAGSLLSDQEWAALVDTVLSLPDTVTANNYFSADLVGWQPASAVFRLEEQTLDGGDNNLAFALCRQAGLTWRTFLPANTRTFGTQFDLDTPSDAALLKLWLSHQTSNQWPALLKFLHTTAAFDNIPVEAVLAKLSDFSSEVLVSGRVSGQTHRLLESKSWGQTRVISEERGMRASGREEAGKAVSLLGLLLQNYGPERFFREYLANSCQAAILDTRVLFAHLHLRPSRRDRFNSDALQPEFIHDVAIQAFTRSALEVSDTLSFPVLLGGHSVVAGGLLLLLDLIPPKPYD